MMQSWNDLGLACPYGWGLEVVSLADQIAFGDSHVLRKFDTEPLAPKPASVSATQPLLAECSTTERSVRWILDGRAAPWPCPADACKHLCVAWHSHVSFGLLQSSVRA